MIIQRNSAQQAVPDAPTRQHAGCTNAPASLSAILERGENLVPASVPSRRCRHAPNSSAKISCDHSLDLRAACTSFGQRKPAPCLRFPLGPGLDNYELGKASCVPFNSWLLAVGDMGQDAAAALGAAAADALAPAAAPAPPAALAALASACMALYHICAATSTVGRCLLQDPSLYRRLRLGSSRWRHRERMHQVLFLPCASAPARC